MSNVDSKKYHFEKTKAYTFGRSSCSTKSSSGVVDRYCYGGGMWSNDLRYFCIRSDCPPGTRFIAHPNDKWHGYCVQCDTKDRQYQDNSGEDHCKTCHGTVSADATSCNEGKLHFDLVNFVSTSNKQVSVTGKKTTISIRIGA